MSRNHMTVLDKMCTRRTFLGSIMFGGAGVWLGVCYGSCGAEVGLLKDNEPWWPGLENVTNRVVIPFKRDQDDARRLEGLVGEKGFVTVAASTSHTVYISGVFAHVKGNEEDNPAIADIIVAFACGSDLYKGYGDDYGYYLPFFNIAILGPSGLVLNATNAQARPPEWHGGAGVTKPSVEVVLNGINIADITALSVALDPKQSHLMTMREWLELQRELPHWPQFENMMNANAGSKRWLIQALEGDQQ